MVNRPPYDDEPPAGGFDPRFGSRRGPGRPVEPSFGSSHDPRHPVDQRFGGQPHPYGDPRFSDSRPDPFDRRGAPPPPPPHHAAPRRSKNKLLLALAGLLLLGAILFAFSLTRSGPGSDALGEDGKTAKASAADEAEARCAAPATYDKLKRELFRQAAAARGADLAVYDRLAGYAALRVTEPALREHDEDKELVECSGNVALDLPPGVQVEGGRRTLSASLRYSLQPAADGNGEVLTLDGAEAITGPLATLARAGGAPAPQPQPAPGTDSLGQPMGNVPPAPAPVPAPSVDQRPAPPVDRQPPAPPPAPTVAERPTASPSFNCARAGNSAERAVCSNPGLASLDRQMSSHFFSARREANATQRVLLDRTRGSFLAFRNRCSSESCIAGAYRDRIREINDIMADRWVAPR